MEDRELTNVHEDALEASAIPKCEPAEQIIETADSVGIQSAQEILVNAEKTEEIPNTSQENVVTQDIIDSEQVAKKTEKKKVSTKKILLVLGIGASTALVIFLILFFTIIQPNSIYEDAKDALHHSDFDQCEQLLTKKP